MVAGWYLFSPSAPWISVVTCRMLILSAGGDPETMGKCISRAVWFQCPFTWGKLHTDEIPFLFLLLLTLTQTSFVAVVWNLENKSVYASLYLQMSDYKCNSVIEQFIASRKGDGGHRWWKQRVFSPVLTAITSHQWDKKLFSQSIPLPEASRLMLGQIILCSFYIYWKAIA